MSASPDSRLSISRRFASSASGAQRAPALGRHRRVAVGLGQRDQFQRVGDFGFQLLHRLDLRCEVVALAHHLLRGGGVIPQRRVFGAVVQFGEAGLCGIPVKDASSAARRTA